MTDATIDFAKMDGLVPGIVPDPTTGQVLPAGFLTAVSSQKTLDSGYVTFWSRTRKTVWVSGESTANRLPVVRAAPV